MIKKRTNGIVLRPISDSLLLISAGGKASDRFLVGDSIRVLQNVSFKVFSQHLADLIRYHLKVPFRDDTGYLQEIDMALKPELLDPVNIKELNEALQCYGLRLDQDIIEIDVLCLSKKQR